MLAEYVYLGDQLLSVIKPGESAYYFHNDHLGTPQVLTNDSQAIAWKAVYTPFGGAVPSIQTVENPFRFPGQYYDQETGLHYNYFRYYNPQTGRYITPDPIGLEGGINLFVYVAGNPVNRKDPLGLFWDGPDVDFPGTPTLPEGSGSILSCRQIAQRIRQEGQQRYPWTPDDRNNHMRHCWASCRLSQLAGSACSFIAGWAQEIRGVYDPADTEANAKGRKCASSGDCTKCCSQCQP
jgi:RHS repeat-associated protein